MRTGSHRVRAAFTLIELMVVITIIAVVSGVMVAEMSGTFEGELLRSDARKLIDACDAASSRAIAVNQPQILRINPRAGKFMVRPKAQSLDEPGEVTTEGELDTRIKLQIREPQRDPESEEAGDDAAKDAETIVFNPDGSAEAREFLLRDRTGVELVLRLNPATSRVRIMEMAAE